MSTAFELLTPKIGNHPLGCPCVTCTAAVAKLKATPYVKLLESELIAAIKANAQGSPAVVSSLEAQVLSLRELLAKRDDDNRTLTNVLAESRKISQERESQLTTMTGKLSACQQTLKSTEDKLNIAQVSLRNANEEKETAIYDLKAAQAGEEHWRSANSLSQQGIEQLQRELKAAKDQQDLTADDLGATLAEVERLEKELQGSREALGEALSRADAMQSELSSITGTREQEFREWDEERSVLQAMLEHAELNNTAAYWIIGLVCTVFAGAIGYMVGGYGR